MNTKLNLILWTTLLATLAGISPTHAANIPLQHTPLFLNQGVEPNLVISFDDSGSMDRGHMPEEIALYLGQGNGVGGDLGEAKEDGNNGNWFQPWATWVGYNTIYYNPATEYALPKRADGTDYPDVTFNNAPMDGYNTGSTRRDLGSDYRISWGCCTNDGPNNITYGTYNGNDNNGRYLYQVGENTAFYHTFAGDPSDPASVANPANYTAVKVAGSGDEQNFARWFSFYRTRLLVAKSGITLGFSSVTAPLRVAWQGLNRNQLGGGSNMRSLSGARRNQLWTYIQDTWTGSGGTPTRAATRRAGEFFERSGAGETNPYWDVSLSRELSCRQNYHVTVTDGGWKDAAGLSGDFDNNGLTLPDGREYDTSSPHAHVYTNEADSDGDGVADIFNGSSGDNDHGFADNAFYYWSRDLRTDLANNVPRFLADTTTGVTGPVLTALPDDPFSNDEIYWNPANDPATWQHMVHFNIGLGVDGEIPLSEASLEGLRKGDIAWPSWGNNGSTSPGKIDDNWHAALNSRGRYFSAKNPNELVRQLSQVLNSIVSRKASASAVAVSSGVLTTAAQSFRTKFNSGDWSGTVESVSVESILAGTPEVDWDAGCNLTEGPCESDPTTQSFLPPDSRNIRIVSDTGAAVPFTAANLSQLSSDVRDALNTAPNGTVDGLAADRINFLRGDRSGEIANGGGFRNRGSVLGDIVNSGAVYVQGVVSSYQNSREFFGGSGPEGDRSVYQAYADSINSSRDGVVYAGANDGMLHAFDTDTGEELHAFIPTPVQENLAALTDPRYIKQSYVDAAPSVQDVFFGGQWRTVLVGGLRLGGQGYYALDITNPTAPELLWEFTDANDADLGYSYSEANIVRVAHQDKWVALLPSGYNAEEADGNQGSAAGALFVVDIETGAVIRKFSSADFGQSVNGLAGAISGDYFRDLIADVAFAGDLDGNVWRFDLTGAASGWSVEKIFQPATPGAQPITARPSLIARELDGALVVMVGTGKYLEPNDRVTTGTPTQYMLGIFDRSPLTQVPGSYPATVGEMNRNTLTVAGTDNRVFNSSPDVDFSTDEGWYIELGEGSLTGERIVTLAVSRVATGRVIFSTLIPAGDDPCLAGGTSYILAADVNSGGPPEGFASFDFDNNGIINEADFDATGGEGAGKRRTGLVVGVTPLITPGGGESIGLLGGDVGNGSGNSDGDGGTGDESSFIRFTEPEWVRRGWRQLFIED